MRILLINHEYPPLGGGGGNATAQIARQLVELGAEPAVLTTRFQNQPAYEEIDGVKIWRISTPRKQIDRSSVSEFMAFMGLALVPTLRLVRQWQPDAAIAFFGLPGGFLALIAKRLFGLPYIVSLRGGDVPGFWYPGISAYHLLSKPLIRLIWRQSIAVVANSKGLQQLAIQTTPNLPISIVPNGVDCEAFRPAVNPRSSASVRLLLVGRLVKQKGVDILLKALSQLKDLPVSVTLDLVGDGSDRSQFATQAQDLGLSEIVKFSGWASRPELVQHYQQADIFVFPSRDEGMPNALLEAMACGLPAIATRIAGSEELVQEGVTGLLVDSEDAIGLANALKTLILDPVQREQMGSASRCFVEENYTWRTVAAQYLDLLTNTRPVGRDRHPAV